MSGGETPPLPPAHPRMAEWGWNADDMARWVRGCCAGRHKRPCEVCGRSAYADGVGVYCANVWALDLPRHSTKEDDGGARLCAEHMTRERCLLGAFVA